jgi:hypothetical protein
MRNRRRLELQPLKRPFPVSFISIIDPVQQRQRTRATVHISPRDPAWWF